jgi:phosphate transport system substrate-binding protein
VPRLRTLVALLAALALAVTFVACGDDDDEGGGGEGGGGETAQNLSGNIAIDGSSTVQPFAEAAVETFNEENPDVNITVGGSGTGDGFEKFCRGETQISDASRPIEEEETAACEKEGIEVVEVQVASDGLSVVTSKGIQIDCMTTDQLKMIFEPGAKTKNYSDVDPKFPDQPISLFTPGTESGTYDYFTDEINGEEGVQREENVQTSADDNQLVTGIEGEESAMGYFGFSFYEQNQDKLNLVGVDSGEGCIKPSTETIQNGTYTPLGRPLYMYTSKAALQKPEVKGFLDFAVQNHQEISTAAKIVPMSQEQADKSTQTLSGS